MDHLRIQISGYPRARPGIRDGGTMMTGQGAHKIVSAAVEPKGPVSTLSPAAIGTFSFPPFRWLKIRFGRWLVIPHLRILIELNEMHD